MIIKLKEEDLVMKVQSKKSKIRIIFLSKIVFKIRNFKLNYKILIKFKKNMSKITKLENKKRLNFKTLKAKSKI